jgi:hypothetical protein
MLLTAQISSSDSSFKLSQTLVAALAEKFGFKFEDGWNTVSTRSIENVQKRLKRARRRANPASNVKHPRTAFSFFTQQQRPIEAGNHKDATFGQLSRFVSEAWKALTPAQLQTYKDMEAADKARYQVERAAALAAAPVQATAAAETAAPAESTEVVEAKPKKERKAKAVAAPAATTEAKPAKAAKAPKAAPATTPAAEAAPAVPVPAVAESKPAKAAKVPKAAKAATPVAATPVAATAAPVAAVAVAPAKVAKAPKAAKSAGKA